MTSPEPQSPAAPKRSILERLGPAGLLGLLWALLPAIGGILLLARIGYASEWLESHGQTQAMFVYISIFIVSAGVGLLPTYAQSILAGWVFGFLGIPAALAGFGGAALIGYAIARFVAQHRVERLIEENIKARAVRDALIGSGFWRSLFIISLVRIPPNSPFALMNGLLATSGVRLLPYFLGTVIGMTPRTVAAVVLANHWASQGARDIQEVIRERGPVMMIVGLVAVIIVLGIIGAIANRAVARVTGQPGAAPTPTPETP